AENPLHIGHTGDPGPTDSGMRWGPADDQDRAETGVGGIGELHPGGQAAAQVVQELTGDALAGDDHRYARRVRGYLLGADAAYRLVGVDGFLGREEGIAGQHG